MVIRKKVLYLRLLTLNTHVHMDKLTFIARIIDQSVEGVETSQDTVLGHTYDTAFRSNLTHPNSDFEKCEAWQTRIEAYYLEKAHRHFGEERDIVGFIYGDDVMLAVKDHQVAYIVTQKGDTVKRVYGQIVRY